MFVNKRGRLWIVLLINMMILLTTLGCEVNQDTPKVQPDQATEWLKGFVGNLTNRKQIVLGYYENPWKGAGENSESLPSMRAFSGSMSAISPYWYKIDKDGTIESLAQDAVYAEARKLGLRVYPLITNKRDATDLILGNQEIRQKATDNLVAMVKEKDYDGVDIDFELLDPAHKDNLTAFMEELYPKMKAINKTVIISVFPRVDVHESVSGAYEYASLAKNTDYVQIMTYDNHWATSKPGPIAPIEWYEKNIKYAIKECGGAGKVLVGVGAYGYDWNSENKGETITYPNAVVLAEQKGAEIHYDEIYQAPYFKYDDHEVWFENEKSITAKLRVVDKYKPAGIAIWRLGQEAPDMWQRIDEIFPKS